MVSTARLGSAIGDTFVAEAEGHESTLHEVDAAMGKEGTSTAHTPAESAILRAGTSSNEPSRATAASLIDEEDENESSGTRHAGGDNDNNNNNRYVKGKEPEQQEQQQEGGTAVPHSAEMIVFVRHCASCKMPIELCYQCFGNPQDRRPVVLLICGLNMQLTAWDESFCEALVRAGFFVVRYDNRDSGYSTKVASRGNVVGTRLLLPERWASLLGEKLPYTMDDMAKDALALLDVLHVPCAHVLGISMGGMIAQTMALLAPSRVLSLTSIMSTTNAPDLPDSQMWVKLWMLRSPPKNCTVEQLLEFRVSSLRRLLERALPLDTEYFKERYLISLRRSTYAAGLIRHAAAIRRCPGRDAALRQLHLPALVVHGAQDLVVPPVHGYRTATVLPHARILIFKNMGHYFHPAFFPTIVTTFADMASTTAGCGRPPLQRSPSPSAASKAGSPEDESPQEGEKQKKEQKEHGTASQSASAAAGNVLPSNDNNTTTATTASEASHTASATHTTTPAAPTDAQETKPPAITTPPRQSSLPPVPLPSLFVSPEHDALHTLPHDEAAELLTDSSTMASIAPLLSPVVTSLHTPTGAVAQQSVMRAVPGVGHPATPCAVLLDLHDDTQASNNSNSTAGAANKEDTLQQQQQQGGAGAGAAAPGRSPSQAALGSPAVHKEQVRVFMPGDRSTWNSAHHLPMSAAEAAVKVNVVPTIVGLPVSDYLAHEASHISVRPTAVASRVAAPASPSKTGEATAKAAPVQSGSAAQAAAAADKDAQGSANGKTGAAAAQVLGLPTPLPTSPPSSGNMTSFAQAAQEPQPTNEELSSMVASSEAVASTLMPPLLADDATGPMLAVQEAAGGREDEA